MPLVRVDIIKGKSPEYKKSMLDCIHRGLVDALSIEDWDRFQRIVEIDRADFEIPAGKTECFTVIELTLFPGRTKEQKRAVIEGVTEKLHEALSIPREDVFIIIHEPPLENWGLGGKQR
jgi:4-oxalocrotonate tautomerase family enzyme